jgi:hypothetical protein
MLPPPPSGGPQRYTLGTPSRRDAGNGHDHGGDNWKHRRQRQRHDRCSRDRQHHCGEPETLLAGITDPANPRTPTADDGSGRVRDQPSDIAAQLGHRDGGALPLKIYVHPLAEGLARAGAPLDQVIGGKR